MPARWPSWRGRGERSRQQTDQTKPQTPRLRLLEVTHLAPDPPPPGHLQAHAERPASSRPDVCVRLPRQISPPPTPGMGPLLQRGPDPGRMGGGPCEPSGEVCPEHLPFRPRSLLSPPQARPSPSDPSQGAPRAGVKLVHQRQPRPSEGWQGPRHAVSPTAESPARGKGPSHAQHSAHRPLRARVRPAEGPRRPASPWGQHTGQSPSLETGSAPGLSVPRAEGPRGRHPPRSPCPGGCRPSASRLPCVAECPTPSLQLGSPKGPWETTRAVGGFPEACMQLAQSSGPPSLHPDSGYTAHPTVTASSRVRRGGGRGEGIGEPRL